MFRMMRKYLFQSVSKNLKHQDAINMFQNVPLIDHNRSNFPEKNKFMQIEDVDFVLIKNSDTKTSDD